jgi:hypothetical protein
VSALGRLARKAGIESEWFYRQLARLEALRSPQCGTPVGGLPDETAYRTWVLEQVQGERDHLRRALEWLGDQWGEERHYGQKGDGHGPNCPLQPTVDLRDRTSCPYALEAGHQPCQVIEGNITWRECCLRSALAATEEVTR